MVHHSPGVARAYPPGSNQYGEAHGPLLRMLVAHDLQTGPGPAAGMGNPRTVPKR